MNLNEQVVQAITQTHASVLGPGPQIDPSSSVARQVGQAAAYEAVAQASAFAVQDAADFMRNVTAVTQAALVVVTQEIVKAVQGGKDAQGVDAAIQSLKKISELSVTHFETVGSQAAKLAGTFPASGVSYPS